MLKTGTLRHGGIMVNYQCNAACRHCLYSCSPERRPGFISEQTADEVCRLLCDGDCHSVHIGGGEPFLNFDGLVMMIGKLKNARITLEYVETNAFWVQDSKKAEDKLKRLLDEGVSTLCISIDPFHAEYVPYCAPLSLAELCDKTGMGYFLWKHEFLSVLSRLDSQKIHSRSEMEDVFSGDYIHKTAKLYGISYGGRAVNIENESCVFHPAKSLAAGSSPCNNLLSTGHFHVDMDSFFIPPHCTGIRIPLSEAVNGIPDGKYPAFEALYSGGVSALLELAENNGFSPNTAGYASKCSLCFYLRKFLSERDFAELDKNHYEEALKNYSQPGQDAPGNLD
jgi:hypothetical protein